ncbi:restriction endonuclease [Symbiobacterium terraclitae]|uniref:restriction endonuclease n=1 Tax=Symbiobacterium terraclitae TaxID=557451 RepID=UPI003CC9C3F3
MNSQIPPRAFVPFEEYIASVFESHGCSVELTTHTRDGEYDIIAIRENPLPLDLRISLGGSSYSEIFPRRICSSIRLLISEKLTGT